MPLVLDRIRHRAKMIMRSQGGSYRAALKKAGKEYREGKKISGPKRKKGKTTRKKVGVSYHPVSVEHCAPNVMGAVSHAKKLLKTKLGWLLATRATARTQRERRALDPRIAELKRQLRALS